MSRYRGPRLKLKRAVGVDLPGLGVKTAERKPYPPGQHGQQRRKKSVYGTQLLEKQKLKFNYGLTEHQLRRYVRMAKRAKGAPGENLLSLLESRLDNVAFRAGLAPSIQAARQLVSHGHIRINGSRVNIPSYLVKAGEVITLGPRSKNIPFLPTYWERPALKVPGWLDRSDGSEVLFKVIAKPSQDSVPFPIAISTVVEFYSKMI